MSLKNVLSNIFERIQFSIFLFTLRVEILKTLNLKWQREAHLLRRYQIISKLETSRQISENVGAVSEQRENFMFEFLIPPVDLRREKGLLVNEQSGESHPIWTLPRSNGRRGSTVQEGVCL